VGPSAYRAGSLGAQGPAIEASVLRWEPADAKSDGICKRPPNAPAPADRPLVMIDTTMALVDHALARLGSIQGAHAKRSISLLSTSQALLSRKRRELVRNCHRCAAALVGTARHSRHQKGILGVFASKRRQRESAPLEIAGPLRTLARASRTVNSP